MADLQVTNTFVDGDTVSATNFNTNYSDIVTYVNNRNSGSSTWDSFYSTHATTVPLVANNSTGTQSIMQLKDNGTVIYEVFDGGVITQSGQIYGRATKTSDQVFTGLTDQKVTFAAVSQVGSAFSVSTSRFTCTANGKYLINVVMVHEHGGLIVDPASAPFYITKNGSLTFSQVNVFPGSSGAAIISSFIYTDIVSLVVGDYFEVYSSDTYPVVSGAATIKSASTKTYFDFVKLS